MQVARIPVASVMLGSYRRLLRQARWADSGDEYAQDMGVDVK
jgi:hypothetical protein